jgi:hypothetical protein
MLEISPERVPIRNSVEKKPELLAGPISTSRGQVSMCPAYTADEERRVVFKIDCVILPMVRQGKHCFMCFN